ncbi:MAG: 16S rRNA (uracil1498-N3)-methyltransferase [Candidatus Paceibacteria bacterium]|jgi:16S rRNA (uracil1498-N3)-methyltransferase
MKQHRFLIDQKLSNQDEITITEQAIIHQMRNVLRLRVGDPIIFLDGTGIEWHGRVKILIKNFSKISKEVMKKKSKSSKENLKKINLYSAMIKKDKYEWVLQKGTEIGVSRFIPVITKRTEKVNLNIERAQKIVKEAVEQSERVDVPALSEPIDIKTAVAQCETDMLVFDKSGELFSVSQYKDSKEVNIFTGPEGGFDESEIEMFKEKGAKILSLGDCVLRAETAAIIIPALFVFKN